MTTHPEELVELVTTAIAASTRYDSAPRDTARNILDALAEHRAARHVEDDLAAAAAVERVLADRLAGDVDPKALRWAATDVVERLLGDPVATVRYDDNGNVVGLDLAWPTEHARACIVARPVLDRLVGEVDELRNRAVAQLAEVGDLRREVADLRARTAAVIDRADVAGGRGLTLTIGEHGPELDLGGAGGPESPSPAPGGPESPTSGPRAAQEAAEPRPGPLSPDCLAGKHAPCSGDAWDTPRDVLTDCRCSCHGRTA